MTGRAARVRRASAGRSGAARPAASRPAVSRRLRQGRRASAATMAAILGSLRSVVLTTHAGPDGDGLGSELGLLRALRAKGVRAVALNADPPPPNLAFLVRPDDALRVFAPHEEETVRKAGAVVLLDAGSLSRIGPMEACARAAGAAGTLRLCIDHHPLEDNEFDAAHVRVSAAATGECIVEIVRRLGVPLTRDIAEPLYAAIVTDSGSFRFSKTTPATHRAAAALLAAGVDPAHVQQELYERNSPARIRLSGAVLSTLRLGAGGRLAWLDLTRAMLAGCGAALDDSADIVNSTVAVEGVEIGILFKELEPKRTKASLRSRGSADVNLFARQFGGGGHRNAAGLVVALPYEEAKRKVLAAAESFLGAPAAARARGQSTGGRR